MIPILLFAVTGCLAVSPGADRISAGDLALAFPANPGVAADTPIALAPAPGFKRFFRMSELRILGARYHLGQPSREICFERPLAPLSPERLLEALQRTLPTAQIEILDFCRQPVPPGELEFPRAQLRAGSAGAIWGGYIRYAANRRFNTWVKVNVSMKVNRVLALGDLAPGRRVAPGEVMVSERDEFPSMESFAISVDEVVGRVPRVPIRAGNAIRASQLEAPLDVIRGDRVVVEVHDGGASLKLEAQAEGSGTAGQTILVRNPVSGKSFRARVEAPGLVSVNAKPAVENGAQALR